MARQENDREDLLREATGLVDRVEILAGFCADPIVCGFRRNAAVSLFIGQQEVYQFNTRHQLRRGYLHGQLIKAERGRLIVLRRERNRDETCLMRHPCDDEQTADHLQRLSGRLVELDDAIRRSRFELRGVESSTGSDVMARILSWLEELPEPIEIAQSPRTGG